MSISVGTIKLKRDHMFVTISKFVTRRAVLPITGIVGAHCCYIK